MRALGIGSVPTTLHAQVLTRVYDLLGIPSELHFHLCIPLGYPRGKFGPTQRRPTAEVTYLNRWGAPVPWGAQTGEPATALTAGTLHNPGVEAQ